MEALGKRIQTKSQGVDECLFQFEYDVRAASVKLSNCFNKFIMLSDTQFIEHVSCYLVGDGFDSYLSLESIRRWKYLIEA